MANGKIRCWSKVNKSKKRYVVCTGSKGQKKRRRSKRLRKRGGSKKIRCWSRQNKSKKRYVVCTGSKGQKRRRKSKRLRKRGGKRNTLLPQSLVNTGRDVEFNLGEVYNGFQGVPPPVNPSPTYQPALNTQPNFDIMPPSL